MNIEKSIVILESLTKGVDPYTGEIFGNDHILNNPEVIRALFIILSEFKEKKTVNDYDYKINSLQEYKKIMINQFNPMQRNIYKALKQWRTNKSKEKSKFPFNIIGDSALIDIVVKNVSSKEELLSIKGIGKKKYELYADEIINLINIELNSESCKGIKILSNLISNKDNLRHGEPWYEQEKIQLLNEYKTGVDIDTISKIHQRSKISIIKTLEKLGIYNKLFN